MGRAYNQRAHADGVAPQTSCIGVCGHFRRSRKSCCPTRVHIAYRTDQQQKKSSGRVAAMRTCSFFIGRDSRQGGRERERIRECREVRRRGKRGPITEAGRLEHASDPRKRKKNKNEWSFGGEHLFFSFPSRVSPARGLASLSPQFSPRLGAIFNLSHDRKCWPHSLLALRLSRASLGTEQQHRRCTIRSLHQIACVHTSNCNTTP